MSNHHRNQTRPEMHRDPTRPQGALDRPGDASTHALSKAKKKAVEKTAL